MGSQNATRAGQRRTPAFGQCRLSAATPSQEQSESGACRRRMRWAVGNEAGDDDLCANESAFAATFRSIATQIHNPHSSIMQYSVKITHNMQTGYGENRWIVRKQMTGGIFRMTTRQRDFTGP